MPETLYTWEMLKDLASIATVCYLIVSQAKKYIPGATDLVAVGVAFVLLLGAMGFTTGLTPAKVCLCFVNAWVVAAVCGKMHDLASQSKRPDKSC